MTCFLLHIITLKRKNDFKKEKSFFKMEEEEEPDIPESLKLKKDVKIIPELSVVKNSLKKIAHPDTIEFIEDGVLRTNEIVTHYYQFIRLYYLWLYENKKELLHIDTDFVFECFRILAVSDALLELKNERIVELKKFHDDIYVKTLPKNYGILSRSKLNQILDYEATKIVTAINNNIKEHYASRVLKTIKIILQEQYPLAEHENINKLGIIYRNKLYEEPKLDDDEELTEIRQFFGFIRENKVLRVDKKKIKDQNNPKKQEEKIVKQYRNKKNFQRNPEVKSRGKAKKKEKEKKSSEYSFAWYIESNPQQFFKYMFNMTSIIEKYNTEIVKNHTDKTKLPILHPLFQVFPIRTSYTPKYITLDTKAIADLVGKGSHHSNKLIWDAYFYTNKKSFKKKGFHFHYYIMTDGVSISIYFCTVQKKPGQKKLNIPNMSMETEFDHLDDLVIDEDLFNRILVAIDPGINTILYCVSEENFDDKTRGKLTYTQNERRHQSKSKQYRRVLKRLKSKQKLFLGKIDTAEKVHESLKVFNTKTVDFNHFNNYLTAKNKTRKTMLNHYRQPKYRRFKWNGYINRQRSEDKLVDKIIKVFGKPDKKLLICFGDYSKKDHHMKFKEPTKCIGMCRKFRRRKLDTVLIDEHKTSCKCNKCGATCNYPLKRRESNPRGKDDHRLYKVHGLLQCSKSQCSTYWTRDRNGALNILKCAQNAIHGIDRPEHLRRTKSI